MSEDPDKLKEKAKAAEDADKPAPRAAWKSSSPPRKPVPQLPTDDELPPPYEAPSQPALPDDDLPPPYEAPQAPKSSSPPRKPVPQLPSDDELPPPDESPGPPDEDLPPSYEAPKAPARSTPPSPVASPPGESAFRRVSPSPAVAPGDARLGGARVQVRERGVVVIQRQHLSTSPDSLSTVNLYHKAQLVWPVAEHKQFVNLAQQGTALSVDANDMRRRGHRITVKTKLSGGLRGNQVYVKLKYSDHNSKRNDPKPGIVGGMVVDWCPEGGIIVPMRAADEQPNCEATFELELGYAGGDEVTVHVGGNNKCEDDQVKIINWRKIGFQITKPRNMELPSLKIAHESLQDVFIEFEKLSEVNVGRKESPPGSWVGGVPTDDGKGWLKDGELIIGDHNRADFEKRFKFAGEKDPIVHLMFCHNQYDGGKPGQWKQMCLKTGGFDKENQKLPDATKPSFTLKVAEKEMSILNPALQDGKHPLVIGNWLSRAPVGHADNKKQGKLAEADVEIASDGRSVKVTLPPEAAQIVGNGKELKDKKHPVLAMVTFRASKGPYEGESNGIHILIVYHNSERKVSSTISHEIGHSINQAVKGGKAPPGLFYRDHMRSYDGKGHQGQHCAFGLSDSMFGKPDFAELNYAASALLPKCVMWGDSSPQFLPWREVFSFCEKCRPYVIAEQTTEFKDS